jgi:hypothetical protein
LLHVSADLLLEWKPYTCSPGPALSCAYLEAQFINQLA